MKTRALFLVAVGLFALAALMPAVGGLATFVQAQSSHEPSGSVAPAAEAFEVVPSDVTVFAPACRSLFIGTGGDLVVDMQRTGAGVTYVVPDGLVLPARVTKVLATGTSASDIVCLY